MQAIFQKYRECCGEKSFAGSVITGLVFIVLSLIVQYIAGTYATERASNPVTDIILSNTRALDVDGIFVYGSVLLLIGVAILILCEPKWIPFILKSVALFTIVRSFFISVTQICPFPNQIPLESSFVLNNFILNKIAFGGDLFFSGHTGIPFLLALIFWDFKKLRIVFLVASLVFGVSVILGHLHYSIDVFSAYFITYGIFHICQIAFPKDYKLFSYGTF